MSKKPSSRFDDLFSAARNQAQETSSESKKASPSKKSKSREDRLCEDNDLSSQATASTTKGGCGSRG
ncbi:MAG: hypothetical protein AB4057_03890 [Crocosphaera sp.]